MSRSRFSRKPREPAPGHVPQGERLQKVLAAAGLGSRRDCEELITTGRVEIDRRVVTELGVRVDAEAQEIRVDGQPLKSTRRVHYMLNKPQDVLCTNFDPSGRTRAIDLVPAENRLFTVGRLDRGSEGLIIVTNDGELANRLAHPRYEVEKTYLVLVAGEPTQEQLDQLRRGVYLAEGVARAERITVKKALKQSTMLEVVLKEGKNREIRRILARIGHKVLSLKRIAMGTLRLGDLPTGAYRPLTPHELALLRSGTKATGKPRRPRAGKPPRDGKAPRESKPPRAGGERPAKSFPKKAEFQGRVLGDDSDRPRNPNRPSKPNRPPKKFQREGRRELPEG